MDTQTLAILCIILAGWIFFCSLIWKLLFSPRKPKNARKSIKASKQLKEQLDHKAIQDKLSVKIGFASIFRRFPIIGMSNDTRAELQDLISAVDARTKYGTLLTPEELYLRQLACAGLVALASLIGVFITPFTVVGIAAIPLVMKIPLSSLKSKREEILVAISEEFYNFYKLYYVQFSRKDNTSSLVSVVNSYIPNCSALTHQVYALFAVDLGKGEGYALTQLDKRFTGCIKIHRFVSVAKARINGDPSAYETLQAFFTDLQEEQDHYFSRELSKRNKRIARLISAYLMAALGISSVVMFYLMIRTTI